MAYVLVADDDDGFRRYVAQIIEGEGHRVVQATDGAKALACLETESFDLVVSDLSMPRVTGIELVRAVRSQRPECEIIVCTAYGSVETAVEAMKLGAFDFVEKPLQNHDQMRLLVARALERRKLRNFAERAEREQEQSEANGPRLSYGDPAMDPVCRAVDKVARTDATVLLRGESGTGKEVVADAIHRNSTRASGPFVTVNCAAMPDTLVESELFGHEKGAFTGATERRRGKIELAEGGTFFLDEIGELRPEAQAKLLRVLEDGKFEHLGGAQVIHADVRWIAATNRDLEAMVADGSFREDLYHRLSIFPIRLPPLRARPADILPIAEAILLRLGRKNGSAFRLSPAAREALLAHAWKGNVRELRNALERATIMAEESEIDVGDLALMASPPNEGAVVAGEKLCFDTAERGVLLAALEQAGGNRRQAADLLGIGLRTLYDKMKRLDVR